MSRSQEFNYLVEMYLTLTTSEDDEINHMMFFNACELKNINPAEVMFVANEILERRAEIAERYLR